MPPPRRAPRRRARRSRASRRPRALAAQTTVAGTQPRRRLVAAQVRVHVRDREASDGEMRPLAGYEVLDGRDRLLHVLEERILRHHAEEFVRLLDAVAEMQVVGVLDDD